MGFLQAIQSAGLLDVGSGRGMFVFPFWEAFPEIPVICLDLLPRRVEFLQDIARGGIARLRAAEGDVCGQPFGANAFDTVTLLEVLEHIPQVDRAVAAAVRMARRYVVVSAPSKPDNNPGHIHLLTKEKLTALFAAAGCHRLHGVPGHLLLVAVVEE